MVAFPRLGFGAGRAIIHIEFGFYFQTPDLDVIYRCDKPIARPKMIGTAR
jgi:hypothetical protein